MTEAELDQAARAAGGVLQTILIMKHASQTAASQQQQLGVSPSAQTSMPPAPQSGMQEPLQQMQQPMQQMQQPMQQMQQHVRRRAAALDSAYDACVSRLSGVYADAVAKRQQELSLASHR